MTPLKKHVVIIAGFYLAMGLNTLLRYAYHGWLHQEDPYFLSLYLILMASLIGTLVAKGLLKKAAKAKTKTHKRLEDD